MIETLTSLISIITPVYNAEKYLLQTLQSVQAQTYQNWEQILVFDAKCSDRSQQIAEEFAKAEPRCRLFSSPDFVGVAANRNVALDNAKGQYLAFLDADDLWHPEKLERQLKFMLSQKTFFCCHDYQAINENGQTFGNPRKVPAEIKFVNLLQDNRIGCLTVMIQKEYLAQRRFQSLKHEDLALWLELLRDGSVANGLGEILASYRVLQSSVSSNKLKSALWRWRIYRSFDLSRTRSMSHLMSYIYFAVLKRSSATKLRWK